MELGAKIKAVLKERGITQRNFSLMTRIHEHKLAQSLNGHRRFTFEEYEIVCFALGVGVDEFLTPKKPKRG